MSIEELIKGYEDEIKSWQTILPFQSNDELIGRIYLRISIFETFIRELRDIKEGK
jgi:hypothetical protein